MKKTSMVLASRRAGQRGQVLFEMVFYLMIMVPFFAGAFSIGMMLIDAMQASQVTHNANVLVVRQIDLSDVNNQKLVVRTATGLNMGLSDNTPDPNGKGVVRIVKIIRVGSAECSAVTHADGSPDPRQPNNASCPNYGYYVFAQKIQFGNNSLFYTNIGSPVDGPSDSQGNISLNNYVLHTGNQAQGFPPSTYTCPTSGMPPDNGVVCLDYSGYAYVTESVFNVAQLNIFNLLSSPTIYNRNVS